MKRLVLTILLLTVSAAWADSADDLRSCQAQAAVLTRQVQIVREVRDYYEGRIAEMQLQLDAVKAELARHTKEPAK